MRSVAPGETAGVSTSAGGIEAGINDVLVIGEARHPGPVPGVAVLRALAEEPRAVVYDLTGETIEIAALVPGFDIIEAYLRAWASTPLLVCVDTLQKRRDLRAHPIYRRVIDFPSLDTAMVTAEQQLPADRQVLDLEPTPLAPRQARRFVDLVLERWDLLQLVDQAMMTVSELVTNVVLHVGSPMTVAISRAGPLAPQNQAAVRVAVRDPLDDMPGRPTPSPLGVDGRGLHLVDQFSSAWGVIPLDDGKVVWAVLDGG
jgi:hypothetical protein